MVSWPEQFAAPKIGGATTRALLFEHRINTAFTQARQQDIRGKQGIAERQVIGFKVIQQFPQQRLLAAALALVRADCRAYQYAIGQVKRADQSTDRIAQTRPVIALLAISDLGDLRLDLLDDRLG